MFLAGSVVASLDESGQIIDADGNVGVRLPATDSPDMNPTGWTWTVKENLTGVTGARTYSMVLPSDTPDNTVDLADVAPADPTTPSYVAVPGDSAYEIAVENGFTGSETDWLASLKGDKGDPGTSGGVTSVNDKTGVVTLTAAELSALSLTGGTLTGTALSRQNTGTSTAFSGIVNGDGFDRWRMTVEGSLAWGPGNAARDVFLSRSGSGTLLLDGTLNAKANGGVRDVKAYGAKGDGVTNDTTAIQAALDAAKNAGGGTVLIPPGTYNVSTFLVVYDHTTISAFGATIRSVGNTGLLRNFLSSETFNGYTGHSNIRVFGGVWDNNASDGTTGTVTATTNTMGFVHAKNITVMFATLQNTSSAHALEFNSIDGGRALFCRFEGYRDNSGDNSRQYSEAVQIDIAVSGSSSIGAYDGTASRNILVQGCYFGASSRLGPFGRAVGSHTSASGSTFQNIQVLGNRIEGTLREGIHGYSWSDAVIANNVISGTGYSGILVAAPSGYSVTMRAIEISGNVVSGSGTDSAIRVLGNSTNVISTATVANNTARNITGNAVHAEYCNAPSIVGNNVNTTSSTGLYALNSDYADVVGNKVLSAGSNGVNISGCTGATVANNTVKTTSSNYGIFVGSGAGASSDVQVTGNHVIGAASAGVRLSANATGCFVSGNKIRANGVTTNGVTLDNSATGAVIVGNDMSGNGWASGVAIVAGTATPKLDFTGGSTSPGHNLI
ncbi:MULTISPECIES: right-handed parallel beta-helix repeat-containing protein [unclassified Streptomyces]|uniref:right-handed parallel beta-helix repeat-containing protein n=1 Tax=unclassified Streptomyces TaxID=2593676 RepID=UPI000B2A2CB0|nr:MULTISPECIES: right-handed parallel beta-helix repeat-containing protein [unclassified Streptomyces]